MTIVQGIQLVYITLQNMINTIFYTIMLGRLGYLESFKSRSQVFSIYHHLYLGKDFATEPQL